MDQQQKAPPPPAPPRPFEKSKPTHYKVICISMYTVDLGRMDEMVATLRASGHSKATRSSLIRAALAQVDLSKVTKAV